MLKRKEECEERRGTWLTSVDINMPYVTYILYKYVTYTKSFKRYLNLFNYKLSVINALLCEIQFIVVSHTWVKL